MEKALFVRHDLVGKINSNMQFSNKKTPTSPDVYPSFFWSQYFIFIKSEEKPRASLMHTDTPPSPGLVTKKLNPIRARIYT